MNAATLAAAIVAAIAACAGVAYQAFTRRVQFEVLGGPQGHDSLGANVVNVGSGSARIVRATLSIGGGRYEATQVPVLLRQDQTQSFTWTVAGALALDPRSGSFILEYKRPFGPNGRRHLPLKP